LLIPFGLSGDSSAQLTKAADGSVLSVPDKNYDPKLLTTVLITGVTALVRGTAAMMEIKGNTYPGQDVRDWLREADITTITNEVSFDPRCPSPSPQPNDLKFCSKPNYIELLEDVGTDVIDMSGDHLQDKGTDPIAYSLDMYKKRGWKYYGGGYNLEDAQKPLLMEKNGTKIAFLGCNAKAPGYSSLDENTPGALHCDMNWLTSKIKEVKAAGYQPIVTFQHLEYYSYNSHPILQKDFREASDAGAVIISGSQGHQPQAIELYNKSFLHYGLGNLFFDQYYEGIPTRQAFLDRHVFYNNQYINTELLTIMFVDLARPRPMTVEERQNLLGIVFEASGVK
jgi:poly-gamma-glutamate synthesis protein (capsule biosynthesis protein)